MHANAREFAIELFFFFFFFWTAVRMCETGCEGEDTVDVVFGGPLGMAKMRYIWLLE